MKSNTRNIAIALLIFAVAGCTTGQHGQAIQAELKKPEDTVAVTATEHATVVNVTSKSGIGGATLVRIGDAWPTRITIRLKLNNLESFDMNNDSIRFNTFIKHQGRVPYWNIDRNERPLDSPDGTLDALIRRVDEWLEILVPAEMIQGNPKRIDFRWINEFRG